MARFDMDRAHEAIEAARVARARTFVAVLARAFEHLATFLRGMATRGLPEGREPVLPGLA
jgi:hypothetical protein